MLGIPLKWAAMMLQQLHVFFVLSFLASGLAAVLAVFAWQQRTARGAPAFTFLMAAMAVWTFAIGCGMITQTEQTSFVWAVIRMAGVFAVPVLWLAFALQFTDRAAWLTAANVILVSIIPLVSLVLMATTRRHHLFLLGIDYVQIGPYLIDQTWHLGSWFWVHLLYSYSLILIGDYFLLREALHLTPQYRRQAMALLIGTAFPLFVNVAYTFHLIPGLIVNYDPFGFVLGGLILSLGLFRFQLFDLKPVARQLLLDSMGDGMLVMDEKGRIVDLNQAALMILVASEDATIGRLAQDVLAPYVDVNALLASPADMQVEVSVQRQGQRLVYDLRSSAIINRNTSKGHLLVLRDVTRRKQLEEQLREIAMTDVLTGLYNRRQFYELASLEYERARRYRHAFALLMIDLDDFKQVNDRFGHPAGDQVLVALADIFRQSLRKMDLIFRYGGDEFAILMPETSLEDAIQVSRRMSAAMTELVLPAPLDKLTITLSQGMALYDGHEDVDLQQLLADADRALYAAKARGKNHLSIAGMV